MSSPRRGLVCSCTPTRRRRPARTRPVPVNAPRSSPFWNWRRRSRRRGRSAGRLQGRALVGGVGVHRSRCRRRLPVLRGPCGPGVRLRVCCAATSMPPRRPLSWGRCWPARSSATPRRRSRLASRWPSVAGCPAGHRCGRAAARRAGRLASGRVPVRRWHRGSGRRSHRGRRRYGVWWGRAVEAVVRWSAGEPGWSLRCVPPARRSGLPVFGRGGAALGPAPSLAEVEQVLPAGVAAGRLGAGTGRGATPNAWSSSNATARQSAGGGAGE